MSFQTQRRPCQSQEVLRAVKTRAKRPQLGAWMWENVKKEQERCLGYVQVSLWGSGPPLCNKTLSQLLISLGSQFPYPLHEWWRGLDFQLSRDRSGEMVHIFNPALWRQRQADPCKLQASLVYIVRHIFDLGSNPGYRTLSVGLGSHVSDLLSLHPL